MSDSEKENNLDNLNYYNKRKARKIKEKKEAIKKRKKENHSSDDGEEEHLKELKKPYPNFPYPMLAHPLTTHKKRIEYPCYVQPKLDGILCIAIKGELYSRNGYPFPTMDHIKAELKYNTDNLVLDGELYTDDINFEQISGLAKRINCSKEDKEKLLKNLL